MTANCLNCKEPIQGQFCASCGQAEGLEIVPLGDWLRRAWGVMLGLDSRFLRTVRDLLLRPGILTEAYASGRRMPFTGPMRLYIVASALAIAVMSLAGVLSFETFAQADDVELWQRFGVADSTDPAFREDFDRRLNVIFPIGNLLSPALLALLLKCLYRRRLFELHLVFSLHYVTFLVLTGLIAVPFFSNSTEQAGTIARVVGFGLVSGLVVYLWLAMKRIYGGKWYAVLPRVAFLGIGFAFVSQVLSIGMLLLTLVTL